MYPTSPKLIGRGAEVRLLENALSDASRGHLRVVLLSGPAGMGKSALVRRFTNAVSGAGAQVVLAECAPEDSTRSFGPLLYAAHGTLFADPGNAHSRAQRPLLDPPERHRAFALIAERIGLMARERPVVLVLEDMQWADEETVNLIPYLSRRASDATLLVVATFRTEEAGSASLSAALADIRRRNATEIELPALNPRQVGVLVGSALGSTDRPDAELQSFVADHSGGNPLFIEELVRGLAQREWLVLAGGNWRSARALADVVLPTSVGESVRARLSFVPEQTRRILSSAAILGQRFDFDLLVRVTGSSRPAVVGALRAGIHAHLIEETDSDGLVYAFRHALFRDALLGEVIGPERQDLHRAIGLALEEAVPEAGRSSVSRELARHFDAAGDAERAVRYHLLAARASSMNTNTWPTGFSANAGVAAHLARAIALAPADHPGRAEMLRVYAWAQDDLARRLSIIEESLAHARRAGDQRGVALSTVMAGVWRAMESDATGVSSIREGIRLLEELGPSADLAEAYFQLARVAMLSGDPDAVSLAERAIELARAHDLPVLLASALVTLGPALVGAGRIEGIEAIRAGLVLAGEHSATTALLRGQDNLWTTLVASGAPDDEVREAERALAFEATGAGNRATATFFDANWDRMLELEDEISPTVGPARAYIGVAREGPSLFLPHALRAHHKMDKLLLLWRGQALLPEVFYLAGDHRAALAAARFVGRCVDRHVYLAFIDSAATAALAAAVTLGDHAATQEWLERCARRRALEPSTAEGRRAYARGESALREGRRDEALDAFARSAVGFERRGATLLARTLPRLRLAELLAKEDAAEAQKQLAVVIAMWRAVDARWYLGRLREWAAARGLRGWTAGARRGPRLTPRELEVAGLVAEGLTNKQIGARLDITERTAETHVQRIVTKLDLRGRSHLAAWVAGARGAIDLRT